MEHMHEARHEVSDHTSAIIASITSTISRSISTTTASATGSPTAAALLSSTTAVVEHAHSEEITGHGHGMGSSMAMTFLVSPLNTPLLFSRLTPTTPGAAFGIWVAIFAMAVLYRGLVFTRTYLEAVYWAPINVNGFSEMEIHGKRRALKGLAQEFGAGRDLGRMGMAFLIAIMSYVLMLVVMSFVVAWFFAVVIGLAIGELVFARLTAGKNPGWH